MKKFKNFLQIIKTRVQYNYRRYRL